MKRERGTEREGGRVREREKGTVYDREREREGEIVKRQRIEERERERG